MNKSLSQVVFTIALFGASAVAVAQEQSPERGSLEVQTVVQKLEESTDASGTTKTELLPLDTALPGDEVVYTVTFTNIGDETAENIKITNPIPNEMRYVAGTAFGPGSDIVYSIDGGQTYGKADVLTVSDNSGATRPADSNDYTHIQWALNTPLEVGERSFARFRAVVR